MPQTVRYTGRNVTGSSDFCEHSASPLASAKSRMEHAIELEFEANRALIAHLELYREPEDRTLLDGVENEAVIAIINSERSISANG